MTTIVRVSSNYESRLHVEEDTDAKPADCFLVTLCPYLPEPGVLVHREGADMNALWAEAIAMVAHLRAQPWKEVLPPNVFQPWATITARNYIDVAREAELRAKMLTGQRHPDHMERVQSLIRAWDLLDGAPLPVSVPWPDFKGMH